MKRSLSQLLKDPRVILGEMSAIGLVCAAGAALPLALESPRLLGQNPALVRWLQLLGFDNLFASLWFLLPLVLACASLGMVVVQQIRRAVQAWPRRMQPEQFQKALFRAEFERPAEMHAADGKASPGGKARHLADGQSSVVIHAGGRISLLGSPLFHTGLLVIVAAGAVRALFGADAVVDLVEGETLRPGSGVWNGQFPGYLTRPISLNEPVTLVKVKSTLYPDGGLKSLSAALAAQGTEHSGNFEVAVNKGFSVDGARLHVGSDFGPAPMLGWPDGHGGTAWEAVLTTDLGKGEWKGVSSDHGGWRAHVRARVDSDGNAASEADIRIINGSTLACATGLGAGRSAVLPDGSRVTLGQIPFWIRLKASRDPSAPLIHAGLTMVILGAFIMFTVIRTDTCVMTTRDGDRERVFVAMHARRFAPLCRERFERLVRGQGGMV